MAIKTIFGKLILLLILTLFIAKGVAASPYGSGAYGECLYDGEAAACDIIDPTASEDGRDGTGEDEPADDGDEGEPALADDGDNRPPTVATVDPLDDDGLPLVPLIGGIAALIGAAILVLWATRRRRAATLAPATTPTYAPQPSPPEPRTAPAPQEVTNKTDVNLMPASQTTVGQTPGVESTTGSVLDNPPPASALGAGAAVSPPDQPSVPQTGQVINPQSSQPSASAGDAPEAGSTQPPPVNHLDIHGPGHH